jgi:hypothetical protein
MIADNFVIRLQSSSAATSLLAQATWNHVRHGTLTGVWDSPEIVNDFVMPLPVGQR